MLFVDVIKQKTSSSFLKSVWVKALLLLATCAVVLGYVSTGKISVDKKDILIDTVKQGDLNITIDGYGKLTSNKIKLITTHSQVTVQEIVLKPGSHVTKETVIVKLASPELHHALITAQQELAQLHANLRQLRINQQRELLDEQANLTSITAQFETAKLRRVAQQKLLAQGIIAEFTYQQTKLNENQLAQRVALFKTRLQQLSVVHQEAINIQKERINQLQAHVSIAQQRVDQLTVVAGIEGVLQHLPIRLGQSLSPGQEIALIGSVSDLIALVRVPQHQARFLKSGQDVEIDTRSERASGLVSRINPVVENNSVEVEVVLTQSLSHNARPEQSVDAQIFIASLNNVLYIERPAKLQANSEVELYKLDQHAQIAHKTSLKFGKKAGRFIEIAQGANAGDQFILTDLNNYKAQQISLK